MRTTKYESKVKSAETIMLTLENLREASYWCGGHIDGDQMSVPHVTIPFFAGVGDILMRGEDGRFSKVSPQELDSNWKFMKADSE